MIVYIPIAEDMFEYQTKEFSMWFVLYRLQINRLIYFFKYRENIKQTFYKFSLMVFIMMLYILVYIIYA